MRILPFAPSVVLVLCAGAALRAQSSTQELASNWKIQSSAVVAGSGAEVSTPGFDTAGWIATSVPSTVFNAQAVNHLVPDPDFGMNLRQAPGVSYKIGANFSHEEMAADSPYRVAWWYRAEFRFDSALAAQSTLWLDFRGINFRANVWLNGKRIATDAELQGTFRRFELDISAAARRDGVNVLAVEVFPPRVHDLAITFVDWNPMPPDKDMGLWGKVLLRGSGAVAIRQPYVSTLLDSPQNDVARLTVSAELVNATALEQTGVLRGAIAGLPATALQRSITLAPHETREVIFAPADTPALVVRHPALWWPYEMGSPTLQTLELEFVQSGARSDQTTLRFGISQVTAGLNASGAEQFSVNGRPILIRGGGWTPDMLLRDGPARWADDFHYVREMNLNAVRLEGKLPDDAYFDLADREGILVLAGWCCCDHWEEWPTWTGAERAVATASLNDQARRLRSHPSLLVWLNGSDNPPPAAIEQAYLDVLAAARWPKPILSSASGKKTAVTGASGVKMTGPYDFVPPNYWLAEPALGGAQGFNTETSPGAAIPPLESLRNFIPAEHLWPQDEFWNFHAGSGQFSTLERYNTALAARYGPPRDLDDYVWKAQAMAYESERAMFESFAREQGRATGVIQWMLNNGWPSLIWHLYDYYQRPGAGYFAVKLANAPLHAEYSDFDRVVTLVNTGETAVPAQTITATTYNLDGKLLGTQRAEVAAAAHASVAALTLAPPAGVRGAYFLGLRLGAGPRAYYWLSTRPDVLDPRSATWFAMPESSYADFRGLETLPPARVTARAAFSTGAAAVTVTNPGPGVAFLLRLRLVRADNGDEALPVWWSDNYITLMPGETRRLSVRYRPDGLAGAAPALRVDGWNLPAGR